MNYKVCLSITSLFLFFVFTELRVVNAQESLDSDSTSISDDRREALSRLPTYAPPLPSDLESWSKHLKTTDCSRQKCHIRVDIDQGWLDTNFPRTKSSECPDAYFSALESPDFTIEVQDGDGVELLYKSLHQAAIRVETTALDPSNEDPKYDCEDNFGKSIEPKITLEGNNVRHNIWIGAEREEQRGKGYLLIDKYDTNGNENIDVFGHYPISHKNFGHPPLPRNPGGDPLMAASRSAPEYTTPYILEDEITMVRREKGLVLILKVRYPYDFDNNNEHEHIDVHAIPKTLDGAGITSDNFAYRDPDEKYIVDCTRIVLKESDLEKGPHCSYAKGASNELPSEVNVVLPFNAFPPNVLDFKIDVVIKDPNGNTLGETVTASSSESIVPQAAVYLPTIYTPRQNPTPWARRSTPRNSSLTEGSKVRIVSERTNVYLYISNDDNFTKITVPVNATVTVLSELRTSSNGNQWYRVEYNSTIGWINARYLVSGSK